MPRTGGREAGVRLRLAGLEDGRLALTWWKYRGLRIATCPENQRPVGVVVASGRAATTALTGKPQLRLSSCSRWPERAGCGQECLAQVENAPDDCLVRNVFVKWYAGKSCTLCRRPFGEISLTGAKPAVLRADKISVDWSQIPVEQLDETLAAAAPICFACHMGNKMVHEHPDLVVDRSHFQDPVS